MNRAMRRTLAVVGVAVVAYVVAIAVMGFDEIADALAVFTAQALLLAMLASCVNYLLRFVKWELCLRALRVRDTAPALTLRRSAAIFLAGLSMSVSPGKVGEVLRSSLLTMTDKVPFSRTAPVVIADRLTDLAALVVLALWGLSIHPALLPLLAATGGVVALAIVLLGSRRFLHWLLHQIGRVSALQGLARKAESLVDASARVLHPQVILPLLALSVVGWFLECVGLHVILGGFKGVTPDLRTSTLLWSSTTVLGAVSFLPGGLGATEGSLGVLLVKLVPGVHAGVAAAATLLARGATLWLGELVGGAALAGLLWTHREIHLDDGLDGEPNGDGRAASPAA